MRDIHDAPAPFNPKFRNGFREAIDKEYTKWSNEHPDHTLEEGAEAYKEIVGRLKSKFPSVEESPA